MNYRRLGNSGLHVSVVGIGCNNFGGRLDQQGTKAVVDAALECGINLFDTADIYGNGKSEEFLGAALRGRREQAVIATKFFNQMGEGPNNSGGGRLHVRRAVDASLQRLGTDYIDLYQMHNPDPGTPLEETLSTLDDLIREGKVRYIGSSNYAGWQIADADWTARVNHWTPFISAQNHYSLIHRGAERDVMPACVRFGVGQLPYFPLANGLLTGKYRKGQPLPEGTRLSSSPRKDSWVNDKNLDIVEGLVQFAEQRGISLLQVAFGGLAAQPAVSSVIAGAMSPEQVRSNAEAGVWEPTPEDVEEINRIAPQPTGN